MCFIIDLGFPIGATEKLLQGLKAVPEKLWLSFLFFSLYSDTPAIPQIKQTFILNKLLFHKNDFILSKTKQPLMSKSIDRSVICELHTYKAGFCSGSADAIFDIQIIPRAFWSRMRFLISCVSVPLLVFYTLLTSTQSCASVTRPLQFHE